MSSIKKMGLFVGVMILLMGCSTVREPTARNRPSSTNKATINICRGNEFFGSGVSIYTSVDEIGALKLPINSYGSIEVSPGKHTVSVVPNCIWKEDIQEIFLEKDENIYFYVSPSIWGYFGGLATSFFIKAMVLEEIDKNQFKSKANYSSKHKALYK